MAIERSVYEVIGKEYRGSRVTQIELRFNPMKRNLNSELDLDHIIHAALRGMDRAMLEYGVKAGLIFCLAREFDHKLNAIILEKAIKYRSRGVVGIDLAGTEKNALELKPEVVAAVRGPLRAGAQGRPEDAPCTPARRAGTGAEGVIAVVEQLKPHRIGHGIRAAYDEAAMKLLKERDVVLELCPTSNLHTKAVEGIARVQAHREDLLGPRGEDHHQHRRPLPARHRHAHRDRAGGDATASSRPTQVDQTLAWARQYSFIPP